jgi:hypothetical protein
MVAQPLTSVGWAAKYIMTDMEKNVKLQYVVDNFHFKNDVDDYLDVEVNHSEKYITLKTDMSGQFSIESVEELDLIYSKLKETLEQIQK